MGDERFDIDVGYRDPDDLPRDDFPEDRPSPAEYEDEMAPLSRDEVIERLARLQEHGFIGGWRRERACWYVEAGTTWGPYNLREVAAWVEGANAMGAAP